MNILLTCVGRCGNILDYFKDALAGAGKVFACDSNLRAPALSHGDCSFVVPPIGDPGYIDALLALCREHQVDLVVPAFEPELVLLAERRCEFAEIGTTVLVSDPQIIHLCYDKVASAQFLRAHEILTPSTYTSLADTLTALDCGQISFPLVVKPRWGVGSMETHFVSCVDELSLTFELTQRRLLKEHTGVHEAMESQCNIIVQPVIAGQEYGVDVINDLHGEYFCSYAKRKLRMRTGQTDSATSCQDSRLDEIAEKLGRSLRHIGILDCDLIVTPNGDAYVLDLNPRLGRGYPLAHLAGGNFPRLLISWKLGQTPDARWRRLQPHITAARCDAVEIVNDEIIHFSYQTHA